MVVVVVVVAVHAVADVSIAFDEVSIVQVDVLSEIVGPLSFLVESEIVHSDSLYLETEAAVGLEC